MSSVYLRSFRVRRGEVKAVQVTCLTVPARFGIAYHQVPDTDARSSASASASATPCVWPSRRVDPFGLRIWQKLMVYAGEQLRLQREPLSPRLVRARRAAGAAVRRTHPTRRCVPSRVAASWPVWAAREIGPPLGPQPAAANASKHEKARKMRDLFSNRGDRFNGPSE
jgi:hypothetical protein